MKSSNKLQFLKKIKVSNFKNFDELEIEFDKFNVIIGSNAAGKSNFTQIFNFLKDIHEHGLDNAILIQGGVVHTRNIMLGNTKDLSIEISGLFSESMSMIRLAHFDIENINYKFSLTFNSRNGYKISTDRIIVTMIANDKHEKHTGTIEITNNSGKLKFKTDFPEKIMKILPKRIMAYVKFYRLESKELLLESEFMQRILGVGWSYFTDRISIYDFEPKLPKKAIPIRSDYALEADGSNIALVLQNIFRSKNNKKKFLNFIKELLPSINSIGIQKLANKSLFFKIEEIYFKKHYLPSSLLSDGTINITSLIVALYFISYSRFIVIEEPERNIHPSLLSNLVDMMKDVATTKQIVITTHNPELVRHAGLENLFVISRTNDGFSKINKPATQDRIHEFLSNELELSDLYINNILSE